MNQPSSGIYTPGTALTVGSHQARIIKYLTSGGFAHIYSAEISPADPNSIGNVACLKRVLVPDKQSLNVLRAEVDAMKLLRGNKHVVSYIDSHAAKSGAQDGSYEVFLLMEYCSAGGLIDFMNTRLQNRLTENEVLKIMSDITQGIAAMHALLPPLIHRDIKIENVLISDDKTFKVCDFGSVCGVIRPPKNAQEFSYVQNDILKNTTAQYRSPEMIDLYRGHPINEKSDIWALGVFLYKLCYYTTPFEKVGDAAILHSRFQFPAYPQYSDRLKNLISVMLSENPNQRPNICQVLEEVSRIQNVPCPLRNFYLLRSMQQQQQQQQQQHQQQQTFPSVEVHHSLSQPRMDLKNGPVLTPFKHAQTSALRTSKTFGGAAMNGSINNYVPVLKPHQAQPVQQNYRSDPFTSIDRRTVLQEKIPLQPASADFQRLSRAQTFVPVTKSPKRSSASPSFGGRGDISMIVSANPTNVDPTPIYLNSSVQTDNPGSDLYLSKQNTRLSESSTSSSESIETQSTGGSFSRTFGRRLKKVFTGEKRSISPIKSRQNTGESVKSAFATLRRGFSSGSHKGEQLSKKNTVDATTNGSSSNGYKFRVTSSDSIEEENSGFIYSHSRKASSTSIVSDLDSLQNDSETNAKKYYRSHSPVKLSGSSDARSSIQKRVQNLLKSSQDSPVKKSAHGYGEVSEKEDKESPEQFTGKPAVAEARPIKRTVVPPPKRYSSVEFSSIVPTAKNATAKDIEQPIRVHHKPKRPTKPPHLKADRIIKHGSSTTENPRHSSDLEIEELEKDFQRRFPSAV